jgi:DNA-binding CsgD family transcriptional regulator/tetratricopeptide (TPR) repeat protein
VGKSRLLRESLCGTSTVTAMASPVAAVPFGVVHDLLGHIDSHHDGAEGERAPAIRRYVAALRRLPVAAVLVEDLHWADADSLAVLVEFARTPDGPVLLASTRDEPSRSLAEALALLSSTPTVLVVALSGLSTGEVAVLVESLWGHRLPVRTAAELRRRTDGLPYWVEELARSATSPADLLARSLPGVASGALFGRVDAGGPGVRTVAELASVLGERVDVELLSRVTERPVSTLLPALRSLVDSRVLVESAGGGFAFRHALTREAVTGRVPDVERRDWHRRAYAVLAEQDAPDATLAWHAAGAGLRTEVLRTSVRGADTLLSAGSGAEALRLAELALRFQPEPAWPVHALAAQAAYATGYYDEAEPHVLAWRDGAAGAGATAEVASAECLRASLRWSAGDRPGQWAALDAALAAATGQDDEVLVHVVAARANALMRAERHQEAIAEADRALAVATRTGAGAARRSALVDKGTALCACGQRAEGLALLAEADAASESAGDVVTLARALNNALEPKLRDRPYAEQWALYDETWRRAVRLGLSTSLGKIVRHAVDLAEWTGQWERGWRAGMARLPEETDRVERVVLAAKVAVLALEADRLDEAAGLYELASAEAAVMDQYWALLYIALLDVALTASRSAPAATLRALGRYRRAVSPAEHQMRPWRACTAAQYALDGGVAAHAVRAFLRTTVPSAMPERCADEVELALAEAAGDHRRAVDAGVRLLSQPISAVRHADALTRLGRAYLALGQLAAAAGCADEACTLLAAWPSGPRTRAARALAAAVRTGAATAGSSLTSREREVRSLVAAGLSNKDIADRLGVSPRTVAVHVSRLLAKTGCGSRTELAVQVLRSP